MMSLNHTYHHDIYTHVFLIRKHLLVIEYLRLIVSFLCFLVWYLPLLAVFDTGLAHPQVEIFSFVDYPSPPLAGINNSHIHILIIKGIKIVYLASVLTWLFLLQSCFFYIQLIVLLYTAYSTFIYCL